MDEPKFDNHYFRLLIIIVFIVFAGFLAFLIFNQKNRNPAPFADSVTETRPTATPTIPVSGGALSMTVFGDSQKHSLAENLLIEIKADLPNIDVVSYDIILSYHNDAFNLVEVKSAQPSFEIYKTSLPDHLSLTGVKKIGETGQNFWSGEKIIRLIFQPKKTGHFTFKILGQTGKEKTQFIDTKSEVYYPLTDQFEVEIF